MEHQEITKMGQGMFKCPTGHSQDVPPSLPSEAGLNLQQTHLKMDYSLHSAQGGDLALGTGTLPLTSSSLPSLSRIWGSSGTLGLVPEAALYVEDEAGAEKSKIEINGEAFGQRCLQIKIQISCCMKYKVCAAGQRSKSRIY